MKNLILCLLAAMLGLLPAKAEKEFVNLTPRPKNLLTYDGRCTLPTAFSVGVDAALGDSVMEEAQRFVDILNASMPGYSVSLVHQTDEAFLKIAQYTGVASNVGNEGYRLVMKEDGITLTSLTRKGFYYGLLSIRKMLPANVALGIPGAEGTEYFLPVATITDNARFAYRGFMLDVSRHFFSVEEIKKMLDIMAIYKMNVFHWHLTDDQGWRAEIKQYPKLTTVGATRSNSWNTDIYMVDNYWWTGEGAYTGKTYGPYFYTQDEMREVVAYAAERHIDVLPEVDMPGHFVAAMAAYPEYSCTPANPPSVWINGGISSNVLNVADPKAVEFAQNILGELCDIFPYPYIHIGGDECPTSHWESNALCQQKMKELGLSSYRALQTHFIKEMSDFVGTKGKRLFCWNESVTAGGADLQLMKETGATIMCWNPCQGGAAKAAELGLDAIITEYHSSTGGYYINRRQSNDYGEPSGAGYGDDTVEGCYNYVPVPDNVTAANAKHYIGVQGTFWTEHVSSDEYLEYLALPRLICVAEAGWSTQGRKNWNDFKTRLTRDTEMLDAGGYVYGRHWMDNYVHRVYKNPIADGAVVKFTNQSTDRPRCLADQNGTLNGQGDACTEWKLEAAEKDGEYYILSNESGKYLNASGTASGSTVTLGTKKTAWTFDETTMSGYVAICLAANKDVAVNNNVNNASHARLFAHGTSNGASFWKVDLVQEPDAVAQVPTATGHPVQKIYDLCGRPARRNGQGLRIVDGTKVFVK